MSGAGGRLMEHIRRIARREAERVLRMTAAPQMGNIIEWDPKTHRARVELQPSGVETNWLPVASPWIGNGWGVLAKHSVGDQVMVAFPEYGPNQGVVIGRLFDQRNPPPQAKDADIILVNSTGSWVALKQGKLGINGVAEVTMTGKEITIKADQTVKVEAKKIVLAGGGPKVARVGDKVRTPHGIGEIITGSSIVESG